MRSLTQKLIRQKIWLAYQFYCYASGQLAYGSAACAWNETMLWALSDGGNSGRWKVSGQYFPDQGVEPLSRNGRPLMTSEKWCEWCVDFNPITPLQQLTVTPGAISPTLSVLADSASKL